MRRRAFLCGLAAVAGTGFAARAPAAVRLVDSRFAGIGQTHLWVAQPGGREEAHVRFRTPDGLLVPEGIDRLSWLWRDWRDADRAVWIDYRLFDILAWIQTRAALEDDRPRRFVLTSGYRTPERNARIEGAARNSQHIHGRAADLLMEGVDLARLTALAEAAGAAGIGRYRRFLHIDVGQEGRRW